MILHAADTTRPIGTPTMTTGVLIDVAGEYTVINCSAQEISDRAVVVTKGKNQGLSEDVILQFFGAAASDKLLLASYRYIVILLSYPARAVQLNADANAPAAAQSTPDS